jgi:hypothetical protein
VISDYNTRRTHARRRPEASFAVEYQKTTTGAWMIFNCYATRAEAYAVANRLRELGAATRVVATIEGAR